MLKPPFHQLYRWWPELCFYVLKALVHVLFLRLLLALRGAATPPLYPLNGGNARATRTCPRQG